MNAQEILDESEWLDLTDRLTNYELEIERLEKALEDFKLK